MSLCTSSSIFERSNTNISHRLISSTIILSMCFILLQSWPPSLHLCLNFFVHFNSVKACKDVSLPMHGGRVFIAQWVSTLSSRREAMSPNQSGSSLMSSQFNIFGGTSSPECTLATGQDCCRCQQLILHSRVVEENPMIVH